MSSENTERDLGKEMDNIKNRLDSLIDMRAQMEELTRLVAMNFSEKATTSSAEVNIQNKSTTTQEHPPRNSPAVVINLEERRPLKQGDGKTMAGETVGVEVNPEETDKAESNIYLLNSEEKERLKEELSKKIQEELKHLKGDDKYGNIDVSKFGVQTEIKFPENFEMPKLKQYEGTTNPIQHLKTYCTQMKRYSADENFLMGLFHESLTGPAFDWFIDLEPEKKQDWSTFSHLFVQQYGFNLDVAPTREQIGKMRRNDDETFKQYAQRWMVDANQVKPPLTKDEMCKYFVGTLGERFEPMAAVPYATFADMIAAGERLDTFAKSNKAANESKAGSSTDAQKKTPPRKNEVQNLQYQPPYRPYTFYPPQTAPFQPPMQFQQSPPYNPSPPTANYPQPQQFTGSGPTAPTPQPTRPPRDDRPFPNFNISKLELYNLLKSKDLISPRPPPFVRSPLPRWYNPNDTCIYHSNAPGHSLENCATFRCAVLRLIDKNQISVESQTASNG